MVVNLSGCAELFRQKHDELLMALADAGIHRVAIWGAGKNGQMCARLLEGSGITVSGFYDQASGKEVHGLKVLPEPWSLPQDFGVIIAMNGPASSVARIRERCLANGIPNIQVVNFPHERECGAPGTGRSLKDFTGIHDGRRCFVVGNGPSLNKIDMTKLKNEIVFGANRCFLGFARWGFPFTYWAVEDFHVGGWQAAEWKQLRGITKFVPADMLYHAEPDDPDICPINLYRDIDYSTAPPPFSVYPHILFSGHTVTYVLLQIAAVMKCSPIYLVGVDFHFTREHTCPAADGEVWAQTGRDQNHFHDDYIPKGRYLHDPHWDLQELAFKGARHTGDLHGFRILNATPGSRLHVFEQVDFESLFSPL